MTNVKIEKQSGIDYDFAKRLALQAEPIQKRVKLSDIEIDVNGGMSIAGVAMRVGDGVIENELFKILNLNAAFTKRFGKLVGEQPRQQLIKVIKDALTITDLKKSEITLIGDPKTSTISHILPGTRDFISNAVALELFEKTMNVSPDLTLTGFEHNGDGFSLTVRKGVEVAPQTKRGMLKGEEFNPGYALANDPMRGLSVSHFVTRLVCTNGMTMRDTKSDFSLKTLGDKAVRNFFESFLLMSQGNFVPAALPEMIEKAMHTNASFHEVKTAADMMQQCSDLKQQNLSQFMPEFNSVANYLASKNVDYLKCSDIQLQNYATQYKLWDVINRVTDFASHDYGYKVDGVRLQKRAGDMLTKETYDTENVLVLS
jgi:hypothetical protein